MHSKSPTLFLFDYLHVILYATNIAPVGVGEKSNSGEAESRIEGSGPTHHPDRGSAYIKFGQNAPKSSNGDELNSEAETVI
jgi:hypothetical protein